MAIVKNTSTENIGYLSDEKGFLTNFIFEILSVEWRDNLYGYFNIKLTKDNIHFFEMKDVSISGPNSNDFEFRLLDEWSFFLNPESKIQNILDIFSYEFDLYKNNLLTTIK